MNYPIDMTKLNAEIQDGPTPLPKETPFTQWELKVIREIYVYTTPIRELAGKLRCSFRKIYQVKNKVKREYPCFEMVIQAEQCYHSSVTLEYAQVNTSPQVA